MTKGTRGTADFAKITEASQRIRAAGVEVLQIWSPEDTLADTRFKVRGKDGESRVLFWREITGYVDGLTISETEA